MQKTCKIFGRDVVLNLRNEGDFAVANELFLDNQYRFCDEVIRRAESCVIDIGGHLGFFSLYAALLNPQVPIYIFEPHIGNFDLLKVNLKQNRIKNVYGKQVAVSGKAGRAELHLSEEDLNHSTVRALEPTGETQIIQTTTLERIFQKNRIRQCDLLKIDCEGAEYDIIYNTPPDTLNKIRHIFLEYHENADGGSGTELKRYLENAGYRVEQYLNSKQKWLGFLWCTEAKKRK